MLERTIARHGTGSARRRRVRSETLREAAALARQTASQCEEPTARIIRGLATQLEGWAARVEQTPLGGY